jgi:hypothetical protein
MSDNFVVRYRGAFSRKECADLVQYIDYLDNNNLLFYDTEKLHQVDNKTINVNNGFNLDVTAASRISQQILPNMKICIDEYVNMFSLLQTSEFAVYDCKLKKIPPGGGFHSWHYENGSYISAPRSFVIQVYLNDEFDGGETEFLYQNLREEAVTGDVIIFPAGFTHTHRGNPPIGGTKYIATTWAVVQDNGGQE